MPAFLRPRPGQLRTAHPFFKHWIPGLSAAYLAVMYALGGPGPEHFLLAGIALVLSVWNDDSRRLALIGLPYLLYALVYDSMRWYADYIRSPIIHVHEPYDFDLHWFGIHGLTPNEWLQRHTSAPLDLVCGLAYTPMFFIGESVLLSIYFIAKGKVRRAERFTWIFVISNLIGFAFYYIYPAAPPWYVSDHGFAVDLSVHASPAGAIRFDQLIGIPLMQGFYGKSADVFGAIPSLHVVYPFLALIYGWYLRRFRLIAAVYFLLVCFAAVYLNHHYLVDIFLGLAIALAVMAVVRAAFGAVEPRRAPAQEEEPDLAAART
ncbi:MAG: inositol phosphorylceramide synthase [Deltaproteobacteria bacterium]|nr:MAG: inositol phosphorylceramide synthase [Deltaproteobacteria bacterium]